MASYMIANSCAVTELADPDAAGISRIWPGREPMCTNNFASLTNSPSADQLLCASPSPLWAKISARSTSRRVSNLARSAFVIDWEISLRSLSHCAAELASANFSRSGCAGSNVLTNSRMISSSPGALSATSSDAPPYRSRRGEGKPIPQPPNSPVSGGRPKKRRRTSIISETNGRVGRIPDMDVNLFKKRVPTKYITPVMVPCQYVLPVFSARRC